MKILLKENKEMSLKKIETYLKPQYIYIPINNVTLLNNKGDYIYKGQMIGKTKDKYPIPVISSVSGFIVDVVKILDSKNNIVDAFKIENDFKEKIQNKKEIKKITDYTKEEFIKKIEESAIVGLSGNGFPTYQKYKKDNIKTLIVNAVECEPYITSDQVLLEQKIEDILESINAIMQINKIEEGFIAIKKSNKRLKSIIEKYMGTYSNIKLSLVDNYYPVGYKKDLICEIKKIDYDKLPNDPAKRNIIVENVSTIYAIYEALKYQKPLTERIITITGEMVKKPVNILIKMGTNLNEVITILGYKRKDDIVLIAGGPMMGKSLENDNVIISPNITGFTILKYQNQISNNCIRCGKCILACPSKIEPVLIKDNINNKEKIEKLNPKKCIECGLCSYVCPAKINLRDYVVKAKR